MSNTTFAWLGVFGSIFVGIPTAFFAAHVIANVILFSAKLLG